MCGLCGLSTAHTDWSEVDLHNLPKRQERYRRINFVNKILKPFYLHVSDMQGVAYLVRSSTGKQAIAYVLRQVWQEAESLIGRKIDILSPDYLQRLSKVQITKYTKKGTKAQEISGALPDSQPTPASLLQVIPQARESSNRIPIHIVTGFLGSGKTTFIRKILSSKSDSQTMVLVNEFGEIGLDNHLIEQISPNTYLMPSGCTCCVILKDIKHTLLRVLEQIQTGKINKFTRIIMETTGAANPATILSTIEQDDHLRGLFRIHGTTCVIDSQLAEFQAVSHPEWLPQVAASQLLVLSKSSITTKTQQEKVKANITAINPDARWMEEAEIRCAQDLFSLQLRCVQSTRLFTAAEQEGHRDIATCTLEFDHPVNWTTFGIWLHLLLRQHGDNILRIKGQLFLQGSALPIVIHGVQNYLYTPEHLDAPLWENSRVVFITRGIEVEEIVRSAYTFIHTGKGFAAKI